MLLLCLALCRRHNLLLAGKEYDQCDGDHDQGYSQNRPVGQPGDCDHDERPREADERADKAYSCTNDIRNERNHLRECLKESEYALQTTDDKEYSQEHEDSEPQFVGRVLPLVHLVG